jgi:hypothetical protein
MPRKKSCSGDLERGKLAEMIHPLNAANNTNFFVSVSNARKETFGVTALLIATADVVFD